MSGLIPPTSLSYTGQIAVPSINRTFPPTTSFLDFNVPTVWVDTLNKNAYLLVNKALGVADWVLLGGSPGNLETLTGNDSVVVVPSIGNINVLGDNASGITFTGSGSTLTGTLGAIPNSSLTHSSITFVAGTGISVSTSPVSLGGTTTISVTGSGVVQTLSDDVSASITPSSGNIQLVGHVVEQGATKFSTVVAGTHIANINPMSSARWIVDPLGFNGTHTTIAAAITSATAGDTIFLLPGTYTENPTLKAGVNICAFECDSGESTGTSNVIINGTVTASYVGTVSLWELLCKQILRIVCLSLDLMLVTFICSIALLMP